MTLAQIKPASAEQAARQYAQGKAEAGKNFAGFRP
jgi:hypothetical protein